MRTRRTADDFVRDMRAKLHTTAGVAPVVTSVHRQEQRDRAGPQGPHHGTGRGADSGAQHGKTNVRSSAEIKRSSKSVPL
jgi:hypothetical protein